MYTVTNVARRDKAIIDILRDEGIIVCNGRSSKTTHFINDLSQGPLRQMMPVQATPIKTRQIKAVLDGEGYIHLGALFPTDIEFSVLDFLAKIENLIILDVQGYVRSLKNNIICPAVSPYLNTALGIATIVKANGAELKCMLGHYRTNLDDLIDAYRIREFIVTLGQKGGYVKTLNGDEIYFKAPKIAPVIDPTGAGDVFLAAYVVRRLLGNQGIEKASMSAAETAARQIEDNYIKRDTLIMPSLRRP